jgi:hypothetical protein
MGETHRVFAATAAMSLAIHQGTSWWMAGASTALAVAVTSGPMSPDVDQYRPWRCFDSYVPDEALGAGGPLKHRGITHWWGLPLLAWLAISHWGTGNMTWIGYSLVYGWAAHLAADFVFGRIPMVLWFMPIGIELKTGGKVEALLRWTLWPTLLWLATVMVGVDPAWPLRLAEFLLALAEAFTQ